MPLDLVDELVVEVVSLSLVEPQAVFQAAVERGHRRRNGLHRLAACCARRGVRSRLPPGPSHLQRLRAEVRVDGRKRQPLAAAAVADLWFALATCWQHVATA